MEKMKADGLAPTVATYSCVADACAKGGNRQGGELESEVGMMRSSVGLKRFRLLFFPSVKLLFPCLSTDALLFLCLSSGTLGSQHRGS